MNMLSVRRDAAGVPLILKPHTAGKVPVLMCGGALTWRGFPHMMPAGGVDMRTVFV